MVNNITNLTGSQSLYDLVKFDNEVTNGIMGVGFIYTVYIILLVSFMNKGYSFEKSLLVASFLCFMVSITLTLIDLLSFYHIIIFAVITIGDGLYLHFMR